MHFKANIVNNRIDEFRADSVPAGTEASIEAGRGY